MSDPKDVAREIVDGWAPAGLFKTHELKALITAALSAYAAERVAAETERCAVIADKKRDAGLNVDLQNEPIMWIDGYEHGCRDVAAAIRSSVPKGGG